MKILTRKQIPRGKIMINGFTNQYRYLDNSFHSPFRYRGQWWDTVTHAYQAMKTDDKDEQRKIMLAPNPSAAYLLGKRVRLRENWDRIRDFVMMECIIKKFEQNEQIRKKLIETKDEVLIAKNYWHDNYWGVCNCKDCKVYNEVCKDNNKLGIILMEVRESFKMQNGGS